MEGDILKNKKILILILMIFCCGWKINYSLEFNNGNLNEKILVTFYDDVYKVIDSYKDNEDIDFPELNLVYNNYYSLYDKDEFYKKEIKSGSTSTVQLTYSYYFDEFKNAIYANLCFNNFYTEETEDYYYIRAYGKFKCWDRNISKIDITTNSKTVVNNLALKNPDGSYTWKITNDDLNDIELKIYKEKYDFKYIYIFISFSILIIIIIFVKKIRNVNKI